MSPAEKEIKRAQLQELARGSLVRAAAYFTRCFACQSFWPALILALTVGAGGVAAIADALAYSGCAVLIATVARGGAAAPAVAPGKASKQAAESPSAGANDDRTTLFPKW